MDRTDNLIWALLILLFFAIIALILFVAGSLHKKEQNFIENHKKICPGMHKSTVIDILGNRYTQSYLKNGVEKLDWRFKVPGYTGRVTKGVYMHASSTTRRISVKFKDNRAIEVKCLNMD